MRQRLVCGLTACMWVALATMFMSMAMLVGAGKPGWLTSAQIGWLLFAYGVSSSISFLLVAILSRFAHRGIVCKYLASRELFVV